MYFVGVMSGTSCDGIDVALVDFRTGINTVATSFLAYPEAVQSQLQQIISLQPLTIAELSALDAKLGQLYAESINQLLKQQNMAKDAVQAIGLHGQTIYHDPDGQLANTWQLGSAAKVAQQTGINTVANFRQMDVAFGGQGAPLAPAFHQQVFGHINNPIVVLNLGGIANITVIDGDEIFGFDTGPANCLMDEWVKKHQGLKYDDNGHWAKQGQVNKQLLADMLSEPYFNQPYPKSTGRELFNLDWLFSHELVAKLDVVDVQRTLLQFTVESIATGLKQAHKNITEMIVCGGGSHNQYLMATFSDVLGITVKSSRDYGVNPDYVEATLMAWLAKQHLQNTKLDLTQITGVRKPLVYGISYRP